MKPLVAALFFLATLYSPSAEALSLQPENVRVALLKGVDTVRIGGNGILAIDEAGEAVDAGLPLIVKRGSDSLLVNGRSLRTLRASAAVSLQVNGKSYRGIIEISAYDKGLLVIDELPLEDYLIGLINCEISSQWPMEAIKAQAVIARSYALYQMQVRKNSLYHMESSVLDQVYDGCEIEDSRAARGVMETAGQVLTFDDTIVQAFYHSNCGGHTEGVENVWGFPLAYMQGVDCKYCLASGNGKWQQAMPLKKLESLLKSAGVQVSGLKDLKPGKRNRSGRLTDLTLFTSKGSVTLSAVAFRKAIGYSTIKSTNFEVRTSGSEVRFSGVGYGHGVGLCQWGSKQRADDGFDYREILSYYYPGTTLKKIY